MHHHIYFFNLNITLYYFLIAHRAGGGGGGAFYFFQNWNSWYRNLGGHSAEIGGVPESLRYKNWNSSSSTLCFWVHARKRACAYLATSPRGRKWKLVHAVYFWVHGSGRAYYLARGTWSYPSLLAPPPDRQLGQPIHLVVGSFVVVFYRMAWFQKN